MSHWKKTVENAIESQKDDPSWVYEIYTHVEADNKTLVETPNFPNAFRYLVAQKPFTYHESDKQGDTGCSFLTQVFYDKNNKYKNNRYLEQESKHIAFPPNGFVKRGIGESGILVVDHKPYVEKVVFCKDATRYRGPNDQPASTTYDKNGEVICFVLDHPDYDAYFRDSILQPYPVYLTVREKRKQIIQEWYDTVHNFENPARFDFSAIKRESFKNNDGLYQLPIQLRSVATQDAVI